MTSVAATPSSSVGSTPVKSRFEAALKEAERNQIERIDQLKNSDNRQPSFEPSSRLYVETSPTSPAATIDSESPLIGSTKQSFRGSLKGIWDTVLNATKVTSTSKVNVTKEKREGFQITEGTGIVRSIVGEWEKLFVQMIPTPENVSATVRAARAQIKNYSFSDVFGFSGKENFEIGSTHVYRLSDLVTPAQYQILEQAIKDDGGRPKVLSSGIYNDSDNNEYKPMIDTTAVAMIDDGAGSVWVALTINLAKDRVLTKSEMDQHHKVGVFFAKDKDSDSPGN